MATIATTVEAGVKKPLEIIDKVTWGRTREARWTNNVGACMVVVMAPLWMTFNWIALEYSGGSLLSALRLILLSNPVVSARRYFPQPSLPAAFGYAAWVLFQALLYRYLPGKRCFGQRTPGGHLLSYTANGLLAWTITHVLFLAASALGILDPATVVKNWQGLFVAANLYGFALSMAAQLKGYWAPSFPEDSKASGTKLQQSSVITRSC